MVERDGKRVAEAEIMAVDVDWNEVPMADNDENNIKLGQYELVTGDKWNRETSYLKFHLIWRVYCMSKVLGHEEYEDVLDLGSEG